MIKEILFKFFPFLQFKQVYGLAFPLKLKVTNSYEDRHYRINEDIYLCEFIDTVIYDMIVYDVGAHIGLFSLCAAKRGAHVIAFEPTYWNFHTLNKNIKVNHLDHLIQPFEVALGSKNEKGSITGIPSSGWGGSSLLRPTTVNEKTISINVFKGDNFIKQNSLRLPDLIKIDVEGYEGYVIEGLKKTIQKNKPILFIEFHTEYLKAINLPEREIHKELISWGYKRTYRKKWSRGEQYHCIYKA